MSQLALRELAQLTHNPDVIRAECTVLGIPDVLAFDNSSGNLFPERIYPIVLDMDVRCRRLITRIAKDVYHGAVIATPMDLSDEAADFNLLGQVYPFPYKILPLPNNRAEATLFKDGEFVRERRVLGEVKRYYVGFLRGKVALGVHVIIHRGKRAIARAEAQSGTVFLNRVEKQRVIDMVYLADRTGKFQS